MSDPVAVAAELLSNAVERLDAASDGFAATAEPPLTADKVRAAADGLHSIADELARLTADLRVQAGRVETFADVLVFDDAGWPAFRESVRSALPARQALLDWLVHAVTAASGMRLDALKRLIGDLSLEEHAPALQWRVAVMLSGLRTLDCARAAPLLEAAARGSGPFAGGVIGPQVTRDLVALLVNLALHDDAANEASRLLDIAAPEYEDEAWFLALTARIDRRRGLAEESQRLLRAARELEPSNLIVAAVTIESLGFSPSGSSDEDAEAASSMRLEAALDYARAAIAGLDSLQDVAAQIEPLIDPPAELWAAVAERAEGEDDIDTCIRAVERLEVADDRYGKADWAMLAAHARETAGAIDDPDPERQHGNRYEAGRLRWDAGQLRLAAEDFRQAAAVAGASPSSRALATIAQANALCEIAVGMPDAAALQQLAEARAACLAALPEASAEDVSYGCRVLADIADAAAERDPSQAQLHRRRALLAAARAVAHEFSDHGAWAALALKADAVDVNAIAQACLPQFAGDSEYAGDAVQVLANACRFAEAIDVLRGAEDDYSRCVRAYALLRLQRPAEALGEFGGGTIYPAWDWAWQTQIASHLVRGEFDRAAEALDKVLESQQEGSDNSARGPDEQVWLVEARCWQALLREPSRSLEWADHLLAIGQTREGRWAHAVGMLLTGQSEDWQRSFEDFLRSGSISEVTEWLTWMPDALKELVKRHEVPWPDPRVLDQAARTRAEELRATDVAGEALGLATDETGAMAGDLCRAVLALAEGPDALDAVVRGPGRWALLDRELQALATAAAQSGALSEALDTLRTTVREAGDGHCEGAEDVLASVSRIVAHAEAADLIRQAGAPPALVEILRRLAGPRLDYWSDWVLSDLDLPGNGTGPDIVRLYLPALWFADLAGRESEHEILRTALPAMRAVTTADVPAVRVSTDEQLDPDGYLVATESGDRLRAGRAPSGWRFLDPGTNALLQLPVLGRAGTPDSPWQGVAGDDGRSPVLAGFTLTAAEVAVREIARLFEGGGGGPDR